MSATKRSKRRMDDITNDEEIPQYDTPTKTRVGRKIKATLLSPGKHNLTSENRQRKSQRKVMYEKQISRLNSGIAMWAQKAEVQLADRSAAKVASNTKEQPLKKTHFLHVLPLVRQYIKAAEKISQHHQPRTFQLLTFGSGDCGQLALSEDVFESRTPKMVNGIVGRVVSIACGGLHTVVALESGRVEIWGCNDHGSLGDCGETGTGWCPLPVRGLIPSRKEVVERNVLKNAKKFWSDMSLLEQEALEDPRKMKSLPIDWQEQITMVAAGDCQTLLLSSTGRVYMCGCYKDKDGKMWRDQSPPDDPRTLHPKVKMRGIDAPEGPQDWPIHLHQMPGKVESISCGASFNAAIVSMKCSTGDDKFQKTCVTWGLGECGELARPVFKPLKKPDRDDPQFPVVMAKVCEEYLKPKPVIWADQAMIHRYQVLDIACGAFHLLVVANDGKNGARQVYASGLNNYGQLGMGDLEPRHELTKVDALENSDIAKVAAGVHHSLSLDSTGESLYGFGRGDYGQMGITKSIPEAGFCKTLPVLINLSEADKENSKITQISCGGNHCMVLTESGDAYTWGYGENNALGHGVEQDEYMPRKFDPMTGINKKRRKDGMAPLNAEIELIDGGGQHSAVSIRSSIA